MIPKIMPRRSSSSIAVMKMDYPPPALVRWGRIELWLEMRLPGATARAEILQQRLENVPQLLPEVDLDSVAAACDGFTGADLKRLIEDGKLLLARDRAGQLPLRQMTEYFLDAAEAMKDMRRRYQRIDG